MNTQDLTRRLSPIRHRKHTTRRGNLLVGCGVVLVVVIILLVIGGIFVAMNVRGWTANASTKAIDQMLTEAQIDPDEHAEIMVHIDSLMTRFVDGDVEWGQFGKIAEQLVHSPVVPAALVIGLDRLYLSNSGLASEEKVQSRIDLARYTQALFDDALPPESINDVLAPVITNNPDDNDIKLNLKMDENGRSITALKSADEVSDEDLRTLVASAKAKADEAGIGEKPVEIDLSDEIGKAIGIALGEIPDDSESGDKEETDDEPDDDDGP